MASYLAGQLVIFYFYQKINILIFLILVIFSNFLAYHSFNRTFDISTNLDPFGYLFFIGLVGVIGILVSQRQNQ